MSGDLKEQKKEDIVIMKNEKGFFRFLFDLDDELRQKVLNWTGYVRTEIGEYEKDPTVPRPIMNQYGAREIVNHIQNYMGKGALLNKSEWLSVKYNIEAFASSFKLYLCSSYHEFEIRPANVVMIYTGVIAYVKNMQEGMIRGHSAVLQTPSPNERGNIPDHQDTKKEERMKIPFISGSKGGNTW